MRLFILGALLLLCFVSLGLALFSGEDFWHNVGRVGSVASILSLIFFTLLFFWPARSMNDEGRELFKLIAGVWHLDYWRGDTRHSEDLRIDENGNYYIERHPGQVYCLLRSCTYNRKTRQIRWEKVRAPGARPGQSQWGILTLSEDTNEMKGQAEYDGHRLEYRRREPSEGT